MRIIAIAIFLTAMGEISVAQELNVRVFPERGRDGVIQFIAENRSGRTKHVLVIFDFLTNARANARLPYSVTVRPGRLNLFRLQPLASGEPSWDYRSYSWDGALNPDVNEDVTYVLPTSQAKSTTVRTIKGPFLYEEDGSGDRVYTDAGLTFEMDSEDTVFSVRAGTVHRIVSEEESRSKSSLGFTRGKSYIQILHRDGTIATYLHTDENSVMVQPQQFVPAGTPLSKFGGDELNRLLKLYIHYWTWDLSESNNLTQTSSLTYLVPEFAISKDKKIKLKGGFSYNSYVTPELMLQELTKREKKMYSKGKLK